MEQVPISSPNQPLSTPDRLNQPAPKVHSYMPIIITLTILALAGIGGSICGLVLNLGKKDEISSLKEDIASRNETISKIEEALGVKLDESQDSQDKPADTEGDSSETPIVAPTLKFDPSYIYIGEWGIKIKIPEDLEHVSYKYITGDGTFEGVVCVTGAKRGGGTGIPEFVTESLNNEFRFPMLGCLDCFSSDNQIPLASGPSVTFEIDDYIFGYVGPQAVTTSVPGEVAWEKSSVDVIKEMLTQNLSKF